MNYMFKEGFLPYHAPLFMDEVMSVVAILPLLVVFAISQAKKGRISLHIKLQTYIYVIGMIFIGYFEYGARVMGGLSKFLEKSPINHTFLYGFLIFHIVIATATIFYWSYTVYFGWKNHKKLTSKEFKYKHLRVALPTFLGITLTSVTGILLYVFMFVI